MPAQPAENARPVEVPVAEKPRVHRDPGSSLNKHSITLDLDNLRYQTGDLTCILTGHTPCALEDVQLRRMWFLGAIWVGESTVVKLPVTSTTGYVFLQYLRTFRWVICFLAPILVVANLELSLDYQWVKSLIFLSLPIGIWFALGYLLKKERLRLTDIDRTRKLIRIRLAPDIEMEKLASQIVDGIVEYR